VIRRLSQQPFSSSIGSHARTWLCLLCLVSCAPEIGDGCATSNDCSAEGNRLCDTTQLGGYCTIFNCDPSSCPDDEAICVQFGATLSTIGSCSDPGRPAPQARTFCMASCRDNGDCRGGYRCMDLGAPNVWGASVVERNPSTTKVCIEPQAATPIDDPEHGDPGRADAVCWGSDQSGGGASGSTTDAVAGAGGQSSAAGN
jgi:hypothetical protein